MQYLFFFFFNFADPSQRIDRAVSFWIWKEFGFYSKYNGKPLEVVN